MSAFEKWLANPTIKVQYSPLEEVEQMRKRVADMEMELNQLRNLYASECAINMRLQDILAAHGIKWQ